MLDYVFINILRNILLTFQSVKFTIVLAIRKCF